MKIMDGFKTLTIKITDAVPFLVLFLLPFCLHSGIVFNGIVFLEILVWSAFIIRWLIKPVYLTGRLKYYAPFFLWLGFSGITLFLSKARYVGVETWILLVTGGLFFVHLDVVLMSSRARKILINLLLVILTIVVLDLMKTALIWLRYHSFSSASRFYSYLENSNLCGAFLTLLFPLPLFLFFQSKKNISKFLALFLIIFTATSVYFTYSRAAWLGIFVELFIYFYIHFRDKQKLKYFFAGVILFTITTAIAVIFIDSAPTERVRSIFDFRYKDTGSRLLMWKGVIPFSIRHLFLGTGIGGLGPLVIQLIPLNEIYLHVHNYYLQILLETGLPGLLLFLWWLKNLLSIDINRSEYSKAMYTGLVGCLFVNLFDSSLRLPLMLFYTLTIISLLSHNDDQHIKPLSSGKGYIIFLVLILPFFLQVFLPSLALYQYEAGRKKMRFYQYRSSANYFRKAIKLHRNFPVYHAALAQAALGDFFKSGRLGSLKLARDALKKTVELFPLDAFYYDNLAWTEFIYSKINKIDFNVTRYFKNSAELDPRGLLGRHNFSRDDLELNKCFPKLLDISDTNLSSKDFFGKIRAPGTPHASFTVLYYRRLPIPGETFFGSSGTKNIYNIPEYLIKKYDE